MRKPDDDALRALIVDVRADIAAGFGERERLTKLCDVVSELLGDREDVATSATRGATHVEA
jgi:hypothetical protein